MSKTPRKSSERKLSSSEYSASSKHTSPVVRTSSLKASSRHHQQHQQQQQQDSRGSLKYKTIKDIIVTLDDNFPAGYNLEPTSSFENSSSRGLIESSQQQKLIQPQSPSNKRLLDPLESSSLRRSSSHHRHLDRTESESTSELESSSNNNNNTFNTHKTTTISTASSSGGVPRKSSLKKKKLSMGDVEFFGDEDEHEHLKEDNNLQKKSKRNNQLDSKSLVSCYLIQQYFVYLILCAILISGSFGFYYVIVSTNLRLDAMEKRFNEKIANRLPMSFVSGKDYRANKMLDDVEDKDPLNALPIIQSLKLNFMKERNKEEEKDSNENMLEDDVGEEIDNGILTSKYFLLERINNSNYAIFPFIIDESKRSVDDYCESKLNYCAKMFLQKEKPTGPFKNEAFPKEQEGPSSASSLAHKSHAISEKQLNAFINSPLQSDESKNNSSTHSTTTTTTTTTQEIFKSKEFNVDFDDNDGKNSSDIGDLDLEYDLKFDDFPIIEAVNENENKHSSSFRSSSTITTRTSRADLRTTTDMSSSEKENPTEKPRFLSKMRHRKRIDKDLSKSNQSQSMHLKSKSDSNFSRTFHQCSLVKLDSEPTNVIFMGMFHCTWMNDIAANSFQKSSFYYYTKSYKGSSLTQCASLEELKSYRCYLHLPLKYSYYGTGHAIYKGFLFYNQDGTRYLISHSIETHESHKINSPDDADFGEFADSLYSVKHSGYIDFEVDENGLWIIYRLSPNFMEYDNNNNITANTNNENESEVTFVIAKIDEENLRELKIKQKWFVRVERENVANMFIACGRLYALKNALTNPAVIYRVCDMMSGKDCLATRNRAENDSGMFNITIASRQITSLAYNPDKKLLYIVDGGSFAYYKMQVF